MSQKIFREQTPVSMYLISLDQGRVIMGDVSPGSMSVNGILLLNVKNQKTQSHEK